MRFFEFQSDDAGLDKFVMILRNHIGRAASKKAPSKLNWNALQRITAMSGFEFAADYETFKSMYDTSPVIQSLVKNFNADGIVLNVPGAPNDDAQTDQGSSKQTSQDQVDQTADSAAAGQLAQAQQTPTPPAQG
jgi:hypothetical protein